MRIITFFNATWRCINGVPVRLIQALAELHRYVLFIFTNFYGANSIRYGGEGRKKRHEYAP